MKRTMIVVAAVAALLAGPPAFAKGKKSSKPSVSCQQIKDEIAAGKSAEDVQKELNTSASHVKNCTTPTHHGHHKTAKKS